MKAGQYNYDCMYIYTTFFISKETKYIFRFYVNKVTEYYS